MLACLVGKIGSQAPARDQVVMLLEPRDTARSPHFCTVKRSHLGPRNLPHLAGTNGKMLKLILDNPEVLLLPGSQEDQGNAYLPFRTPMLWAEYVFLSLSLVVFPLQDLKVCGLIEDSQASWQAVAKLVVDRGIRAEIALVLGICWCALPVPTK